MRLVSFGLADARRFRCQPGSDEGRQAGCEGTNSLCPAHLTKVGSLLFQELSPVSPVQETFPTPMPALSKLQQRTWGRVGETGHLELGHLFAAGAKVQRKQWGASTPARAESCTELSVCKPSLKQAVQPQRLGP